MKNKKEKWIIGITLAVITIIFTAFCITSAIISNRNKSQRGEATIHIYQYHTKDFNFNLEEERILYTEFELDYNTKKEFTINSLDGKYYNHIVINNGEVFVDEANCQNHYCMQHKIILNDDSLLSFKSISCMPSGLYIEITYK